MIDLVGSIEYHPFVLDASFLESRLTEHDNLRVVKTCCSFWQPKVDCPFPQTLGLFALMILYCFLLRLALSPVQPMLFFVRIFHHQDHYLYLKH